MAYEPKRPVKTEVLSMRMDPKTRFLVDVLARYRGQSISTVVERAIIEAADNTYIGDPDAKKTWRKYWHISEGVRALNMSADQALYPTYEDECRLVFARTHWPFFYISSECKIIKSWCVDILWPHMEKLMEKWEDTKSNDYFATGIAMKKILQEAGLAAPEWPIKREEKPPAQTVAASSSGVPSWTAPKGGDLDDDIPL